MPQLLQLPKDQFCLQAADSAKEERGLMPADFRNYIVAPIFLLTKIMPLVQLCIMTRISKMFTVIQHSYEPNRLLYNSLNMLNL